MNQSCTGICLMLSSNDTFVKESHFLSSCFHVSTAIHAMRSQYSGHCIIAPTM
ncbi:unnamed protein product [Haemonchus placei]|uniref:Uncharacterized protein n=1 Tax=Haemonchus placei TaxID=6290 RepID=A0A3P7WZT0_HAEPC|nr:unnamed protein product [Haemonchus placei]